MLLLLKSPLTLFISTLYRKLIISLF